MVTLLGEDCGDGVCGLFQSQAEDVHHHHHCLYHHHHNHLPPPVIFIIIIIVVNIIISAHGSLLISWATRLLCWETAWQPR